MLFRFLLFLLHLHQIYRSCAQIYIGLVLIFDLLILKLGLKKRDDRKRDLIFVLSQMFTIGVWMYTICKYVNVQNVLNWVREARMAAGLVIPVGLTIHTAKQNYLMELIRISCSSNSYKKNKRRRSFREKLSIIKQSTAACPFARREVPAAGLN